MREFKLLYSYEEWKEKKSKERSLCDEVARCCEDTAKSIALAFKAFSDEGLTEEEKVEQKELEKSIAEREANEKFTNLTHQITDLCLNPKKHYVDLKRVGKLAYELERLKYPVVVPKREESI